MSKNYLKLSNQGSIFQNLMLLNEMRESVGYCDENGYFSKRAVAEIAVNSAIVTSSGRSGNDIISLVSDTTIDEGDNSVLQNAKQRMQLLRELGLVSTDYDAEQYAITDLGLKVLDNVFPNADGKSPDFRLLREAFMSISTSSETYDFNCELMFNCILGYEICYALANLDYKIGVKEMPCITTYDIHEIDKFIETVKFYRNRGETIPSDHDHYPKTQAGTPLKQASNITRTINQIMRICGIFERKTVSENRLNYYVCTKTGQEYVNEVKRSWKKFSFYAAQEVRKKNLIEQKNICNMGFNNMLSRGGYEIPEDSKDDRTVFSPYQMFPETNVSWFLEKPIRKPPVSKKSRMQVINGQITGHVLKLKPEYRTQKEYEDYLKMFGGKTIIINEIRDSMAAGKNMDNVIEELCQRHKKSDKQLFYPFVHSLIETLGIDCMGEVARYDLLLKYKSHLIPGEIKSFTETPAYNMKGVRQALENKITTYKDDSDLEYSSLLIGYSSPSDPVEIHDFIDAAFDEWNIKIVAIDLRTLVKMAVRTVWKKETVDFDNFFTSYGIMEA